MSGGKKVGVTGKSVTVAAPPLPRHVVRLDLGWEFTTLDIVRMMGAVMEARRFMKSYGAGESPLPGNRVYRDGAGEGGTE